MERNYKVRKCYPALVEKLPLWFTEEQCEILIEYWNCQDSEAFFVRKLIEGRGMTQRDAIHLLRKGDKYLNMYVVWKDEVEKRERLIECRKFHRYMTNRGIANMFGITVPEVDFVNQVFGDGEKWQDPQAYYPPLDKDEEDENF